MMTSTLTKWAFGTSFAAAVAVPIVAFAQEGGAAAAAAPVAPSVAIAKAAAAGAAMSLSAMSAAYAQARIGAAGAGTLAERPEVSIWIITLQALPEVIVLLGFVSAILING